MDHKRIYDDLIDKRSVITPEGYVERHHIKLRSLGGSDEPENLVYLTAREHYIAHLLLAKFQPCKQTAYALWMMQCGSKYTQRPNIRGSRMYEWARKQFSEYHSGHLNSVGSKNSQFGKMWICNVDLRENRKISKDEILPDGWIAGRNRWKCIKVCPTCKTKFEAYKTTYCSRRCVPILQINPFAGKKHTEETKQKMRIARAKQFPQPNFRGSLV